MHEFFDKYADTTALVLTLIIPLLLTIYLKTKVKKGIRAIAVYFFVFGPSGILSFIFFHLFENSYRAAEAAIDEHFEYNFRFYSLILFGVVVAYLGILYLKACFDKCISDSKGNRSYFYKILLVLLVTAPLIPVTPIAGVPAICCAVSILALPFIRRKKFSYSNAGQGLNDYRRIKQASLQEKI